MTATLPLGLVVLLAAILSPALALKPRFRAAEGDATAVISAGAAAARVTEAPSRAALDLRLRYAADALERRVDLSVDSCASACINAAVTKSTSCKVGDWSCECSETNQAYIEAGALSCVYQRCGYAVGANVFSEAADFCLSFNNGEFSTDAATSVTAGDATDTKTVIVVTKTDLPGSVSFSTTVVTAPTGSSSGSTDGGGGSSSSGSSGSSGSSSPNPSQGLSTGAIAGIAIGAAAGGIILCVALFFIWRSCSRRPQRQPISYAPVSHTADDGAAAAAAYPPPPGGRSDIDGTSTMVASTASPSPAPGRDNMSKLPSVIATPSPAPTQPVSPVQSQVAPTYPNMSELHGYGQNVSELHSQALQQQYHHQYADQPQQGVYMAAGYQPPAGYSEVEGAWPPEMQGDTYITQELHGQHVRPELHGASATAQPR